MGEGGDSDVLRDLFERVSIVAQGSRTFAICNFGEKLYLTKLSWMSRFWCDLVVNCSFCVKRVMLPV